MPSTDSLSGAPRLGLLYQNILTGVVRIQSDRQTIADIETFRRRMKSALQQAEREANAAGYGTSEIRDASFAVVALLDETILSSRGPRTDEWQTRPLIIELFGQAIAGDVFFDKLLDIERQHDSPRLADLLEVYLVCLLLGFEGRFAPPLRGETFRIMERVRGRIESVRGSDYRLSPPLELRTESAEVAPKGGPQWHRWVLGGVVGTVLLFFFYSLTLSWRIDHWKSDVAAIEVAAP